jgi:hypothetical protein
MQELLEKLLEHAKANPGEFLTGVATLLLVVITGLLVKATRDLAVATRVLAQSAAEDSRNRRVQATADAWMNLRRELDLPHLTEETPENEIDAEGEKVRPQLRALEVFSVGINSGVYDLEAFKRMSGSWFSQQIRWIYPFIKLRQKRNPDAYKELVDLARVVHGKCSALR